MIFIFFYSSILYNTKNFHHWFKKKDSQNSSSIMIVKAIFYNKTLQIIFTIEFFEIKLTE